MVGQPPAPPEAERARLLVPGVHADLDGGRGTHHGAALGARAVEADLHGVVTRLVEEAGGFVPRILAETAEGEIRVAQDRAYGVEVGGDGPCALHQGGGGCGAELQLAARFDGERRTQGQGPQCGEGRFTSCWWYGEPRVPRIVDEPFELHTEEAGRTGLEADATDQRLHFGLGDGGAAGLRTVTHRIGHVGILLRFHPCRRPGKDGPGRQSLVPPKTFLPVRTRVRISAFVGRETLLRRPTSIAHHAFMSTTGEARGAPGETARGAAMAPTGVAP
jgi:hypothetical protein